jgi:hypothetical protein
MQVEENLSHELYILTVSHLSFLHKCQSLDIQCTYVRAVPHAHAQ